jgi:beta-glucosidase
VLTPTLISRLAALACMGLLMSCTKTPEATDTFTADMAAPLSAASANASAWPKPVMALPSNPALEENITQLLARMSLEQKVGQLIQPELRHLTPADVTEYSIGSLLNGGGSYPNENKNAKVEDWLALADSFYRASMSEENGRLAIPIMWGTDAVHGHNNVIGATLFPHNIALGATHNPALIEKIGAATAAEIAVTGIDWSFAPTLAVARDDRWGRTYESYSEDPALVKSYAGKMVAGLQGAATSDDFLSAPHVLATAKHFLADGGTANGVDRGDAAITEQELMDVHGAGYVTALAAGAQTVMASFSSWRGEPMHGNSYLLTQVLKQQMGFDGLVVGDWNGHAFVPGCSAVSCPQAINAGLDIFMAPDANWKELYHNTLAQAKTGEISSARLDDAVARILRVKLRAGLFTKGLPSARALAGKTNIIGSAEHRAIARQAVRESLVLLKNQQQLLPIKPGSKILLAGDGADNIGKQAGGWSITWQGTGNQNSDFPGATSIYQALQAATTKGALELSPEGNYLQKPDVALVVFGEDPYAEMQGDINELIYRDNKNLALLNKLRADGIKVVSLFITGRPLWINPFINASDAFVVIWHPGTEAAGISDVLMAKADTSVNYDFSGRLSFSWPASPHQTPLNAQQENYQPQFALGFGLSYQQSVDTPVLDETLASNSAVAAQEVLAIFKQRLLAPWAFVLSDDLNHQLRVTTSSGRLGAIRLKAIDYQVQEDARHIQWDGSGKASLSISATERTNLMGFAQQQAAIVMAVNLAAQPSHAVSLAMRCGTDCGGSVELNKLLAGLALNEWQTIAIPLACFSQKNTKMDMVLTPVEITTEGRFDLSIYDLRIEKPQAIKNIHPLDCQ